MERVVLMLSIPGLRARDLAQMPVLTSLLPHAVPLTPSFPCVTWPVQANMLTGRLPREHGVVGNGFYWRETRQVEMWTAGNERIEAPQIWDHLKLRYPDRRSAVWFPMLSKRCGADYVCMPAPVHHPDGSESLWCYTKPAEYYGELRAELGDFPLHHFWGPAAGRPSSAWIVESAVQAARRFRPSFFYIYLPHLDYAAQRDGPDSAAALAAVAELDTLFARLAEGCAAAYGQHELLWLAATEYVITAVDHVSYPNRVLRDAGYLQVRYQQDQEWLDWEESRAWALVDHQFSHVFVRDPDPSLTREIARCLAEQPGISEVLVGAERGKYALDHPRTGDVVVISDPTSWQAYYWWYDNARAPDFARRVDIHRKPGYDPAELFRDGPPFQIALDATRVRGSHGAPVADDRQRGVLLSSHGEALPATGVRDIDLAGLVLRCFEGE